MQGSEEWSQIHSKEIFVLENYISSKTSDCTEGEYPKSSVNPARYLLVWGCGEFGQHGYDHNGDVTLENSLGEIRDCRFLMDHHSPVAVACGSSHTLALADNNMLFSWGNGTSGQLGNNTCETVHKPMPVALKPKMQIKGMACGARHSFLWTTDGQCYSFGNNFNAQLGYNFAKTDFKDNQLKPVLVEFFPGLMVKEVACGARHSLFLLTTGHVMAVGCNQQGQNGNGSTEDVVIPTKLEDLGSISHIACGNSHSLACDETGRLYAWGYGKAFGTTKARHIVSPQMFNQNYNCAVASLAGGDSHSMALYENGVLYTWGNNYEGQLGLGKSTKYQSEPEPIPEEMLPRPTIQISCGETTCAAITGEGKLYMWGKNAGLIHSEKPSQFFQFEPYQIKTAGKLVKQVSCGAWHVSAIIENINEVNIMTESQGLSTLTEVELATTESTDAVLCDYQDVSTEVEETLYPVIKEEIFTENHTSPWVTCYKDIFEYQHTEEVIDSDDRQTMSDTIDSLSLDKELCDHKDICFQNDKENINKIMDENQRTISNTTDNLYLEDEPCSDARTNSEELIVDGYAAHTIPIQSTSPVQLNEDKLLQSNFDRDCVLGNTNQNIVGISDETTMKNEYNHNKYKKQSSPTNTKKKSSVRPEISFAGTRKFTLRETSSKPDHTDHDCNVSSSLQEAINSFSFCQTDMNENLQSDELLDHECNEDNDLLKLMKKDIKVSISPDIEAKQQNRIVRSNTIPMFSKVADPTLRPQTVPVINLDFQSSPQKLSVPTRQDQLTKQKSSLHNFKNIWKSSNMFREKQTKKLLNRRKKSQSDIDLVFNLEHTSCVLPDCQTDAQRIKKWTRFRDSPPEVRQRAQQVGTDICLDHSGEILPAICSCKSKNHVLTRTGETNVFIERKWTY